MSGGIQRPALHITKAGQRVEEPSRVPAPVYSLPTGVDDGCTWPHMGRLLRYASKAESVRGQLAYTNGIEDHRLDELILFPTANEEPGHLVVMS